MGQFRVSESRTTNGLQIERSVKEEFDQARATYTTFQEQRCTASSEPNEGKTSYEIATLLGQRVPGNTRCRVTRCLGKDDREPAVLPATSAGRADRFDVAQALAAS